MGSSASASGSVATASTPSASPTPAPTPSPTPAPHEAHLYVGYNGPDNYFFHVSNIQDSISVFSIDPATSALSYVGGIADTDLFQAPNLFASNDGNWLFVDTGNVAEFQIDGVTGALSKRLALLPNTGIVGIDPVAPLMLVNNSARLASYWIHSDGTLQLASSVPAPNLFPDRTIFDQTGACTFVGDGPLLQEFQVNPQNGALTGPLAVPQELLLNVVPLGFDTTNHYLLGSLEDPNTRTQEIFIFDLDQNTCGLSFQRRGIFIRPMTDPGMDHIVLLFLNNLLYARTTGTMFVYAFDSSSAAITNTSVTFQYTYDFNVPFLGNIATSSIFMVLSQSNEVETFHVDLNTDMELSRHDYPAGTAPSTMAVSPPQ
jgi:hypothetical protein